MAKYLTVNSTFRPFSYQELLQPALMATEAHYQQEEALSALESEAAVWEKLGDNPLDRAQYETYKNYMQGITNARDALLKQGINSSSRKGLMDLKRDYGQKIKPIADAYQKREQYYATQLQGKMADDSVMYDREASEIGLGEFMTNPNLTIVSASGKNIQNTTSKVASNLARELRNYRLGRPIDDYTKAFIKDYGLSSAEINNFIANPNDPRNSRVLKAIYDSVYSTVPEAIRNRYADEVNNRIYLGLFDAIGQDQVSPMEDFEARLNAKTSDKSSGYALVRRNIYNRKDVDNQAKNIKKFQQYFVTDSNGRVRITDEGLSQLRSQGTARAMGTSSSGAPQMYNTITEFRQFAKNDLGFTDTQLDEMLDPSKPGRIDALISRYNKYLQDYEETGKYDATRSTQYVTSLVPSGENQAVYKAAISYALGTDGELYEASLSKDGSKYEKGEKLKVSDLMKEDYVITHRGSSVIGDQHYITEYILNKKTGETKEYLIPGGINPDAEAAMGTAAKEAKRIELMLLNPNLSEKDRQLYTETYEQLLQSIALFDGQLDITNTTEKQKKKPTYIP